MIFQVLILALALLTLAYAFSYKFLAGRWPEFVRKLETKID